MRLPQNEYSSEQLQQWVGKLSPTRQCGQKPLLRMNAGSCKPALCGLSVGSDETALSPSCSQRLALPPHSATARPAPRNDSVFLYKTLVPIIFTFTVGLPHFFFKIFSSQRKFLSSGGWERVMANMFGTVKDNSIESLPIQISGQIQREAPL